MRLRKVVSAIKNYLITFRYPERQVVGRMAANHLKRNLGRYISLQCIDKPEIG